MHLSLPPLQRESDDNVSIEELTASALSPLCAIDVALLTEALSKNPTGKIQVAILPDIETIQWQHSREEFVSNELFQRVPVIKGALTGILGKRVWCIWTRT